MANLHFALRGVRRTKTPCSGNDGNLMVAPHLPLHDGEEMRQFDTMTLYEEAQLKAANHMRCMRELVTLLDQLPPDASRTNRIELCRQIRGEERQAKLEIQVARKQAQCEKRQREFDILFAHFKNTRDLVRGRYGGSLPVGKLDDYVYDENDEKDATAFTADTDVALHRCATLSAEAVNTGPHCLNRYDIHNDAEFANFIVSIKKNDVAIDDALDRIASGVQKLNGNALQITSDIQLQEQMLDDIELKVGNVHSRLERLNIKLKDALKKMDRPKVAVYLFCCLILLVIIALIFFLAKS